MAYQWMMRASLCFVVFISSIRPYSSKIPTEEMVREVSVKRKATDDEGLDGISGSGEDPNLSSISDAVSNTQAGLESILRFTSERMSKCDRRNEGCQHCIIILPMGCSRGSAGRPPKDRFSAATPTSELNESCCSTELQGPTDQLGSSCRCSRDNALLPAVKHLVELMKNAFFRSLHGARVENNIHVRIRRNSHSREPPTATTTAIPVYY